MLVNRRFNLSGMRLQQVLNVTDKPGRPHDQSTDLVLRYFQSAIRLRPLGSLMWVSPHARVPQVKADDAIVPPRHGAVSEPAAPGLQLRAAEGFDRTGLSHVGPVEEVVELVQETHRPEHCRAALPPPSLKKMMQRASFLGCWGERNHDQGVWSVGVPGASSTEGLPGPILLSREALHTTSDRAWDARAPGRGRPATHRRGLGAAGRKRVPGVGGTRSASVRHKNYLAPLRRSA
jgi:hypothetical protein